MYPSLLQGAVLGSGAPLPWPETPGCPGQPSAIRLPMGMAGLTVMALAGNFGFDSRETLGKGRHHPVSPDAHGSRQHWMEVRLGCQLGPGVLGWLTGEGSIPPGPPCSRLSVGSGAALPGASSCQPGPWIVGRLLLPCFRFLMGEKGVSRLLVSTT